MSVSLPRPRHLVLMTRDLPGTTEVLEEQLGIHDPFADPIAAEFGLRNVIYAVGDTMLEVCTPVDPQSAGSRHLDRVGGDCGYMVIFQVADLDEAIARVDAQGVRRVWQGSRPGIEGIHLHPADVPGLILSLDQATPPATWAWGGPAWEEAPSGSGPNPVTSLTIEVPDPDAAARTWAGVLGLAASGSSLDVAGTHVRFVGSAGPRGLVAVSYRAGDRSASFDVSGVRFDLEPAVQPQGAAS